MLDDPSVRMIAALGASIALGTWARRRAVARRLQWEQDPSAARAKAVKQATMSSSGLAYVGSAVLCFGVVLFVECIVTLGNYFS